MLYVGVFVSSCQWSVQGRCIAALRGRSRANLPACCACRKETPRDVSAQFKEDSKGPITPVSQSVQLAAAQGKGKASMKAVDGNEATANIAYAFNDVSFIYPITPATPMGEWVDQWSNEGRVNLHNNVMEVSSGVPTASLAGSAEVHDWVGAVAVGSGRLQLLLNTRTATDTPL
jgi:hypothetical protein